MRYQKSALSAVLCAIASLLISSNLQARAAELPDLRGSLTSGAIQSDLTGSQPRIDNAEKEQITEVDAAPGPALNTTAPDTASGAAAESSDARSGQQVASPPEPIQLPESIAQSVPARSDDTQQFDLTPIRIPERGSAFNTFDSYKARLLYRLPARMYFSATVENSLRVETNVFQTSSNAKTDMIYRILPNVTMGYALTRRTRVGSNLFFLRDQYTENYRVLSRNIYSVGIRADHDIPINERTTLTGSLFTRELFFNLHNATPEPLLDLIPSATLVRRVGQRGIIYGSVLGQVRFTKFFDRFQEFDQFYSIGWVYRRSPWIVNFDTTFLTNFGNSNLRGGPNNQMFILTAEVARRLSRIVPVSAFVRVEPIFNMGGKSTPGFSGVNFRCFGGLRTELSKPAIFPIKLKGG